MFLGTTKRDQWHLLVLVITCLVMFGKAIWDKLQCIFGNFEIATVKREQFQNVQKSRGLFMPKITRTKQVIVG